MQLLSFPPVPCAYPSAPSSYRCLVLVCLVVSSVCWIQFPVASKSVSDCSKAILENSNVRAAHTPLSLSSWKAFKMFHSNPRKKWTNSHSRAISSSTPGASHDKLKNSSQKDAVLQTASTIINTLLSWLAFSFCVSLHGMDWASDSGSLVSHSRVFNLLFRILAGPALALVKRLSIIHEEKPQESRRRISW